MLLSSHNPFAAWNVYASQLVHLGYGHPLWCPDPVEENGGDEVQIGDVGYLHEGRFIRLFNACYDKDHFINRYGVPEGFELLDVHPSLRRHEPDFLPVGPLCSKSTESSEVVISGGVSSPVVPMEAGGGYSFAIDGNRGAVTLLKDTAIQENILPCLPFEEYILIHHLSWCKFAARLGHKVQADDIVLVSGWVKTSKWALFAYADETRSHRFSLSISSTGVASIDGNFSVSQSVSIPKATKCGPKIETRQKSLLPPTPSRAPQSHDPASPERLQTSQLPPPPRNQCLFLRYYKCHHRGLGLVTVGQIAPARFVEEDVVETCYCLPCLSLFGSRRRKGRKANSTPTTQGPPDDTPDVDEVPPSDSPDPVMDGVLQYMEQHSDARTVVTSHDDLDVIFEDLSAIPEDIVAYLKVKRPTIVNHPDGLGAHFAVVTRFDREGRPIVKDDPAPCIVDKGESLDNIPGAPPKSHHRTETPSAGTPSLDVAFQNADEDGPQALEAEETDEPDPTRKDTHERTPTDDAGSSGIPHIPEILPDERDELPVRNASLFKDSEMRYIHSQLEMLREHTITLREIWSSLDSDAKRPDLETFDSEVSRLFDQFEAFKDQKASGRRTDEEMDAEFRLMRMRILECNERLLPHLIYARGRLFGKVLGPALSSESHIFGSV